MFDHSRRGWALIGLLCLSGCVALLGAVTYEPATVAFWASDHVKRLFTWIVLGGGGFVSLSAGLWVLADG